PDGRVFRSELAGATPVLTGEELAKLVAESRRASEGFGRPLDMEWAIDRDGRLFWLQARPITVSAGDLHEFDHCPGADHVYTTANIGEMLSGAVCPLTLSTTVWGIDQGSQHMWHASGTHPEISKGLSWVGIFNGHLFIDMTAYMPFSCGVAGASPEVACVTLLGHVVPELVASARYAPVLRRVANGVRFFRYLLAADRCMYEHEKAVASFAIPAPVGARGCFEAIDRALPFLAESYKVHLQVSARAAVWAGVLEGMAARRKGSVAEREASTAALLAGAGEVVSAQLIHELESVLDLLQRHPRAQERFLEVDSEAALKFLMGPDSGEAGGAFRNYLARWGHRAYRELDLAERGWADDPLPLAVSLRASLAGRRRKPVPQKLEVKPATAASSSSIGKARQLQEKPSRGMRWALQKAKRGVAQRERTKNLVVLVTDRFKRAYRHLAEQLVLEGRMGRLDDVFCFTHDELGRLARSEDAGLAAKAGPRRDALQRQQSFEYPTVSIGVPEPLADEPAGTEPEGELRGKPVSPGVARGRARVVQSVDQSAQLEPGEILIAPCADVGWTPYFNLIAGLATEVGSAFCHGAVVAREYGLPTVVNLRGATKRIQTGDYVLLDADHGVLRKLTADEVVQKKKGDAASPSSQPPTKRSTDEAASAA
ncbi:MAG: hypothetical protein HY901_00265, partial [Deltaproteobacteria bacterium]|nr:hypothetical protein [Deltaproteobacteria bacterium]